MSEILKWGKAKPSIPSCLETGKKKMRESINVFSSPQFPHLMIYEMSLVPTKVLVIPSSKITPEVKLKSRSYPVSSSQC